MSTRVPASPAAAVVIVMVIALSCPALARGDIRSGGRSDPLDQQEPSLNPSYRTDLQSVSVTYDQAAGTVQVAGTFFEAEQSLHLEVGLAHSCEAGTVSSVPGLTAIVESDVQDDGEGPHQLATSSARLEGFAGSAPADTQVSSDGRTISATFAHAEFAGRDWRCVSGWGGNSGDSSMEDDFTSFYFAGWAPDERPQGCTRAQADAAGQNLLLPYAARHAPRYYRDLVEVNSWGLGTTYCADLTGDGDKEMVVELRCCTGGSLSPWGIFAHDARRRWRLVYAQIDDTVFRLSLRGRTLRAVSPAPYEGACTPVQRDRIVRWDGHRFRSHRSRRYRVHLPKKYCSR